MKNLKTQFEIRYSTILNFENEYKAIISPYLKFCEFNINNIDSLEEFIVLTFKSEKYTIDCRWDRIILLAEGDREDLKKQQGPFFTFFEIFNKFKDLPTFGKVQNILLAEWNLIEFDHELADLKDKFRKDYLSNKSFSISREFENEDFSVTYTFGDTREKFQRVTFGPYIPDKDIPNYNLTPISKKLNPDLKSAKGILTESFYFEKANDATFDTFKKANKLINNLISEINVQ